MKKIIIALVLGVLFIGVYATTALADNGPHGGFAATTDACAGCHRAHTAQYGGNALLKVAPTALCMSCHADGLGASTDVKNGVYTTAAGIGTEGTNGAPLLGGGFTNALMTTAWTGNRTYDGTVVLSSRPTTSMHDVDASGTVWGSGANNTANATYTLECTSCHDPHGKAGWDTTVTPSVRVASYRLLRWQPEGSNGFTVQAVDVNWTGGAFPVESVGSTSGYLVPDNYATIGGEWYTLNTPTTGTSSFAAGDYTGSAIYNNGTQNYTTDKAAIPYFCAQCHDRYFNNTRLRNTANSTSDTSTYCGKPSAASVANPVPVYPDADGVAPWIHPDAAKAAVCLPVLDATGTTLVAWGDTRPSGDSVYMFRHSSGDGRPPVDGSNLTGSAGQGCMNCHVFHGTAAKADAVATDGVNAASATLAGDSALLRLDGRTLCLKCHANDVNFTVGP